jgi:hypothetical protein
MRMIHLAGVVLLVACPACRSTPAGNPPERVVQSYYDALNRRDMEGVLAAYAPNAVFVAPADSGFAADTVVQGIGELRDFYEQRFKLFPEMRVEVRERRVDGRTVMDELLIHGDPCGGTTRGIVTGPGVAGQVNVGVALVALSNVPAVAVHANVVGSEPADAVADSAIGPFTAVSMASAITSRETSEYFMASVPMPMPSVTVGTPNTCGMAPASRSATIARSTSGWMPALQGFIVECPLATPTMGFSKSPSPNPTARSMARFGERATPWVMRRLRRLSGMGVSRLL